MRLRLATSLSVALLLGLQGPACLALCDAGGRAQAEPMAAHRAAPPCHDGAAAQPAPHPEPAPAKGGCPDDCSGCGDREMLLTASAPVASAAVPALLVLPAPVAPTPAVARRGRVWRPQGQDPPPRDLWLVTSTLRL